MNEHKRLSVMPWLIIFTIFILVGALGFAAYMQLNTTQSTKEGVSKVEDSEAKMKNSSQTPAPSAASEDAVTAALNSTSSSDDVDSIQKDINNTQLDGLDAETNVIESQLE